MVPQPDYRLKTVMIFVGHQLIGTFGIAFLAYFALYSSAYTLNRLGLNLNLHYVNWILTDNPYFPIQIALGLYVGWQLGRRWKHHAITWVWVIPLIILACAVATNYTEIPEWNSVITRTSTSGLSRYFGWNCRPSTHCLDQLTITMPFYVSCAYSLGGWLSLHAQDFRYSQPNPTS